MAGRILSMQRQARELGRLRTGYTDTSGRKPRPVKSPTWVITGHAEHYIQGAAEAWGGTPEQWQPLGGGAPQYRVITTTNALDAILPPGDPLSQSFELWSGGGCARRCDGFTETLSDKPCLCRAEHGDDFHEKPKGTVCAATTRLNVFLPEMPDVGVWRLETHSWYAAGEIAGAVDLIRSAVGQEAIIPIRLRIEQRQRKAGGQTKNFPVVVVELRGITTGQVLGASVMGGQQLAARAQQEALTGNGPATAAIGTGNTQPAPNPEQVALPAGAPADTKTPMSDDEQAIILGQIAAAGSLGEVRAMWKDLAAAFHMPVDGPVALALQARATDFAAPPPDDDHDEGDAVSEMAPRTTTAPTTSGDPDELWATIMRTVPADWTSSQVDQDFANFAGITAEQAGAADMTAYLQHLRGEAS